MSNQSDDTVPAASLPSAGRNGARATFMYRHDDGQQRPVRMRRVVTGAHKVWEVDPADWFMFADGWRLVNGKPLDAEALATDDNTCPQVWPSGLNAGMTVPCEKLVNHRSWHTNAAHDIQWAGTLTPIERLMLEELRATKIGASA